MSKINVELNYFDRVDRCSIHSTLVSSTTISGETDIEIFEQFYKKNNSLRYCSGSYFQFAEDELKVKYDEWIKSDDYKKRSFEPYYGNGLVD